MNTTKENILKWATRYVPEFNDLANKGINGNYYSFYTQSPLDKIDDDVFQMIIGINPAGPVKNEASDERSVSDFLKGNPTWNTRFDNNGNATAEWRSYVNGIHSLMGQNLKKDEVILDNDTKTVYTNLFPFQSPEGSHDLPNDFSNIGAQSTLDLIQIVKPKRIILLGGNAFKLLKKFCNGQSVEYKEGLIANTSIKIGRINGVPTYCINHYSAQWAVSHYFTGIFMNLMNCMDIVENGKATLTIEEVAEKFNHEMQLLKKHL